VPLNNLQNKAVRFTYDLQVVTRSVGYLHGGYFKSVPTDVFQSFNTITGVASFLSNTGYWRSYVTGVSGNFVGWYTINNNSDMTRWSYVTSTGTQSWQIPGAVSISATRSLFFDKGFYGRGQPQGGPRAMRHGPSSGRVLEMYRLDTGTETHSVLSGATDVRATSRQAAATTTHCWFPCNNGKYERFRSYSLETEAAVDTSTGDNPGDMQIETLGNRSSAAFQLIGRVDERNSRIVIDGAVTLGRIKDTNWSYQFGESHALTSDTRIFAMCGFQDTTGRFQGHQHGLCESFTMENGAITTLNDLRESQSSGQMLQGF